MTAVFRNTFVLSCTRVRRKCCCPIWAQRTRLSLWPIWRRARNSLLSCTPSIAKEGVIRYRWLRQHSRRPKNISQTVSAVPVIMSFPVIKFCTFLLQSELIRRSFCALLELFECNLIEMLLSYQMIDYRKVWADRCEPSAGTTDSGGHFAGTDRRYNSCYLQIQI